MSVATGTVTGLAALKTALLNFLTTDTTLVGLGQEWTQVWSSGTDQVVLRGPGLAATDEIYIGLRFAENPSTETYVIWMRGMTGIVPGAVDLSEHINVQPREVGIYADNSAMQYWFVANGRRFIVALKVSTVFEVGYAGLYLPYALPTNYGYPLFVGGSRGEIQSGTQSWRSVDQGHTNFSNPIHNFSSGGPLTDSSSAYMLDPLGTWFPIRNVGNADSDVCHMAPINMGTFAPWFSENVNYNNVYPESAGAFGGFFGTASAHHYMRRTLDGGYALNPLTMVQWSPAFTTWGVLQGVYHVPGFDNSSENIVEIDTVDHLVIQNTFRTGNLDYIAIALE